MKCRWCRAEVFRQLGVWVDEDGIEVCSIRVAGLPAREHATEPGSH